MKYQEMDRMFLLGVFISLFAVGRLGNVYMMDVTGRMR